VMCAIFTKSKSVRHVNFSRSPCHSLPASGESEGLSDANTVKAGGWRTGGSAMISGDAG
jgi:hypothetical protein